MIRRISNCDVNFMYSNSPKGVDNKSKTVSGGGAGQLSLKMAKEVAVGAAAVAVLGGGAYYFANLKKISPVAKKVVDEGQKVIKNAKKVGEKWIATLNNPDKEKGILNFVAFDRFKFVKHVKSDGYKSLNAYMDGGLERLTYINKSKGGEIVVQDFLSPQKLIHQRTVYRGDEVTRYDFAYSEGKPVGYAKEVIKRGEQSYPESLQVKMYDGRVINEKYIDDLYENVPEFNPENLA